MIMCPGKERFPFEKQLQHLNLQTNVAANQNRAVKLRAQNAELRVLVDALRTQVEALEAQARREREKTSGSST